MDTNSYINLSDNCSIFDNLDESIKEFYNNFLKLFEFISRLGEKQNLQNNFLPSFVQSLNFKIKFFEGL